MESIIEHTCCAARPEKAEEAAHECEWSSLPGAALSDSPVEHRAQTSTTGRNERVATQGACYEHRQGSGQSERSSTATHSRQVCERGS